MMGELNIGQMDGATGQRRNSGTKSKLPHESGVLSCVQDGVQRGAVDDKSIICGCARALALCSMKILCYFISTRGIDSMRVTYEVWSNCDA